MYRLYLQLTKLSANLLPEKNQINKQASCHVRPITNPDKKDMMRERKDLKVGRVRDSANGR